jgi:hypothetical protein
MALSIWAFITIIGGIGIVVAIIGKLSGVTEALKLVLEFFGHVFSTIRDTFTAITHVAPPFIKIILFLLIFWTMGAFLFSMTIGAAYVCHPQSGDLYRGSIDEMIMYYIYPTGSYAEQIASNDQYSIEAFRPGGIFGEWNEPSTDEFGDMVFWQTPAISSNCGADNCPPDVGMYYIIPSEYPFEVIDGFIANEEPFAFKMCYLPPRIGLSNDYEVTSGTCYLSVENCRDHAITNFAKAPKAEEMYQFTYQLDNKDKIFNIRFKPTSSKYDLNDCTALPNTGGNNVPESVYLNGNYISLKFKLKEGTFDCGGAGCIVYDRTIKSIGSPQEIVTRESPVTARTVFMQKNFKMVNSLSNQSNDESSLFSFACVEDKDRPGFYDENETFKILGIPIFDIRVILIIIGLTAFFGLIRLVKR